MSRFVSLLLWFCTSYVATPPQVFVGFLSCFSVNLDYESFMPSKFVNALPNAGSDGTVMILLLC
jgi:hypothetical protein